ncbi:general stress protein [Streptomyces spiralis]|uniref:general stress protein n=1 Tax=Streptomyces spiralis TaxID=66376 RepID=UPI00367384DF
MTVQRRRPVASYKAYRDAEHTVDRLSDHGFPVETVAMTGQDACMVERVIGRMDCGRAAGERCALRCPDRPAARPCEPARPRPLVLLLALDGLIFGMIGGPLFGLLPQACGAVAGMSPRSARCSRAGRRSWWTRRSPTRPQG